MIINAAELSISFFRTEKTFSETLFLFQNHPWQDKEAEEDQTSLYFFGFDKDAEIFSIG